MAPTARTLPLALAAAVLALPPPRPAAGAVCTPALKWIWDGKVHSPTYPEVCTTPLVVQLTDDNGDGRIDSRDVPDVVFVHSWGGDYTGVITAVDGRTGVEHWTTTTPLVKPTALAAGDLDGDGLVDLVAIDASLRNIDAFDHNGVLMWTSAPSPVPLYEFDAIGIADLDQDGSPEIYVGATVWNADGSFRWQGTAGTGTEGYWNLINISQAVDLLPASPGLELLAGHTAYDPAGGIVWDNPTLPDGWTAAADFDGDGRAEVVLTTLQDVYMLDDRGNPLGPPHTVPGKLLRQPMVADLDGDGRPEVFVVNSYQAEALAWTGSAFTVKWTQAVSDDTGVTGAIAYDLDGDGAAEVLYHDEVNWFVFDGRTGAVLSRIPFPSATSIETPVVADIDGDCVADILVSGCAGAVAPDLADRVIAYECTPAPTPRALWNQYGYHVTNVNDDGTIPRVERAPWTAQNTWYGQVPAPAIPVAAAGPDADVCQLAAVTLDGGGSSSPSCASGLVYEWRDGTTVVRPAGPDPRWSAPTSTIGAKTYTLAVWCGTGCEATDPVTVTVRACTLAVHFGRFAATAAGDGSDRRVEIGWTTLLEEGTTDFAVERARSAAGPFVMVSLVAAHGAGDYAVVDAGAPASSWYRVVELTVDGRGDATPPFPVRAATARSASGGRGRGRARPR